LDTINLSIGIIVSVLVGLIAGFSTIYIFNRIPAKWLCDYKEEPNKEMWGERIKERPWKIVFILVFMGAALKLMDQGILYQIAGMLALWLLLQIGIADKKYMIIPDQFVIALAVTALGFIPFQSSYLSPLYGALIGGGSLLFIGILGQFILKKEAMGFGDVKLLTAIGLLAGIKGSIIILILTVLSSGVVLGIQFLIGAIKRGEEQPLGPFIAASTAAYILFQKEILILADWYLSLY
jgi:leader peptidase (prepilin peptidase) / N-methyltransferase